MGNDKGYNMLYHKPENETLYNHFKKLERYCISL